MRVGLDIGYSSVKCAYGAGKFPELFRIPVGAAPLSKCGLSIDGQASVGGGHIVMVNNEQWAAGVLPQTLQGFVPIMDDSYSASFEYEALFKAVLSHIGVSKIESLVTGLPVSHFQEPGFKERIIKMMQGIHTIRPGLVVEVEHVKVVPQPAGSYGAHLLDLANRQTKVGIDSSQTVLVVDPGHFSLDWVVNSQSSFKLESSGSTQTAGEAIVRRAAELLTAKHRPLKIRPGKLQDAVLSGAKPLLVGGKEIEFWDTMEEAASEVVRNSLKAIRGSIREVNNTSGVDVVLIAGGSAQLFEKSLTEAFPEATIVAVRDSVTANARGFWAYSGSVRQAAA